MTIDQAREQSQQNAQQRHLINNRPASAFLAQVVLQSQFWSYLTDKTGELVTDAGAADQIMKKLIAISSKADIDRDLFAFYRFRFMFKDYQDFVRGA